MANYIYLDTQVNKSISDEAPAVYFAKAKEQCKTKNVVIGNIASQELLKKNLAENCIPDNVDQMTFENYDEFLQKRRMLMADLIHQYYMGL